ncbi:hypothetical protein CA13_19880 [Planctomycetes bacterium CA13]|uniref:Uncharacterized protein n=1 Tax=Novipirellula herctigrandis TaxID=2527986 RepID=A0A5C5Z1S7_9BACT|nr:hypothetical protein CA13_19880 [Planctomycetes bacterium CA13]
MITVRKTIAVTTSRRHKVVDEKEPFTRATSSRTHDKSASS